LDAVLAALTAQHAELGALLDGLDDADWELPSRCDGWDVSDVVLHVAQTDEMAIASVRGRFPDTLDRMAQGIVGVGSVENGAGALVAKERGASPADVHDRWRRGATELVATLRATDPHARLTWVAGELSARTLVTTRLAEAWIHTGDVAYAFGLPPEPTDRLWHIARLAWRTVPYAFAQAGEKLAGPVAFELTGPGGEPWFFAPEEAEAITVVRGEAIDLCEVAGQRADARDTSLSADGPDGERVLALVRTFA
jgi:uncharacterized protein (TIGR03084 family)